MRSQIGMMATAHSVLSTWPMHSRAARCPGGAASRLAVSSASGTMSTSAQNATGGTYPEQGGADRRGGSTRPGSSANRAPTVTGTGSGCAESEDQRVGGQPDAGSSGAAVPSGNHGEAAMAGFSGRVSRSYY